MGILTRWFGGAAAQPDFKFSPESRMCIFDASKLAEAGGKNGAAATPRDNFETLKLLTQFAAQEGLRLTAVFTGRPLREAAEGDSYKNVTVHYAENTPACRKTILQLIQGQAGGKAVVVTADAELERMAAAQNADCMRISTFKKALENRDNRDNRDNRRPSRPRRNGPAARGNGEKEQPPAEAPHGSTPAPTPAPDAPKKEILDLIDPI